MAAGGLQTEFVYAVLRLFEDGQFPSLTNTVILNGFYNNEKVNALLCKFGRHLTITGAY